MKFPSREIVDASAGETAGGTTGGACTGWRMCATPDHRDEQSKVRIITASAAVAWDSSGSKHAIYGEDVGTMC